MADEHLVCEYCKAEFDSLEAYVEHKQATHAAEERARERQLDEESRESFPASDTPTATNPAVGLGETADETPRTDGDPELEPPAPR